MTSSRKALLLALGWIAGGTLLFLLFLGVSGDADDNHPFGLLDWVVAGVLIGPGFGYLLRWKHRQGR